MPEEMPEVIRVPPVVETTVDTLQERTHAVDVLRGVALLGILLVNIFYFGLPLGELTVHAPPSGSTTIDAAAYYFVKIAGEGKFYTIFSTLFGFGLAVQYDRAKARGERFGPRIARRIIFLAVVGLLHGLLVWYGDVLLTYAVFGSIALLFLRARPRTQIIVASVVFAVSTLLAGVFTAISSPPPGQSPDPSISPYAERSATSVESPGIARETSSPPASSFEEIFGRGTPAGDLFAAMEAGRVREPSNAVWKETETRAYRQGPYIHALVFRAMSWGMMVVLVTLFFGWSILAMMIAGMAVARLNTLARGSERTQLALARWGLGLGVPLAVVGTIISASQQTLPARIISGVLTFGANPLWALGVMGLVAYVVNTRPAAAWSKTLANVGRTAFSCYLMESVLATAFFYHFGLRKFATISAAELLVAACAIYAVVAGLAILAQRCLRMGPFEWLWRCVTYWKFSPLQR
jgi:uncharacterized protein